jgi:hypothetical protein
MVLYIWRGVFSLTGGRFFIKMLGILSGLWLLLLQLCSVVSSFEISRYLLKSSFFWLKDDTGMSRKEFLRVMKSEL